MSAILIYYFYATAPEGLGLTKVQASQMITLNSALGSIFSVIGSYMSDRVFGNRKAYRFVNFTGPFLYFLLAIPGLGMTGVIMQYALGNVNAMICGSSLYTLMGKLYAKGDKRRDGAFAITYVLSNIGAMSPIVAGTLAKVAGYHFTFFVLGILGALGSLVLPSLLRRELSARSVWNRTIRFRRQRERKLSCTSLSERLHSAASLRLSS